jgi:hypothetical protein
MLDTHVVHVNKKTFKKALLFLIMLDTHVVHVKKKTFKEALLFLIKLDTLRGAYIEEDLQGSSSVSY